jgi:hypothetical protein
MEIYKASMRIAVARFVWQVSGSSVYSGKQAAYTTTFPEYVFGPRNPGLSITSRREE